MRASPILLFTIAAFSTVALVAGALVAGTDIGSQLGLPPSAHLMHCQVLLDADVDVPRKSLGYLSRSTSPTGRK